MLTKFVGFHETISPSGLTSHHQQTQQLMSEHPIRYFANYFHPTEHQVIQAILSLKALPT
jgi:hypothetical protein